MDEDLGMSLGRIGTHLFDPFQTKTLSVHRVPFHEWVVLMKN